MSKTTTTEFLIRYTDQYFDYKTLISSSCKTWNTVATNQLKRRVNNETVLIDNRTECSSYTIHFQNGSKAHFLFIPKKIKTYDLHEEIRKAFSKQIKDSTNISFNLLNLEENHQKLLVETLSSCVELYKWSFPKYGKCAQKDKKIDRKNVGFYTDLDSEEIDLAIKYGENIAKGTNLARRLCVTPTNYMTSKDLVKEAKYIAKKHKLKVVFEDESRLKEMNAGAFLSVIQGTKGSDGGILHLKYKSKNPQYKIGLVGKGMAFDTGGYNIKGSYMEDMHRDMTGAAVALGLFEAVVKSQLDVEINLYLAIAENLISEKAYKPNDVVTTMDGTSIEIKDTDAEGRMCLIDTLLYAKRHTNDLIIDFATLTGAALDAIDQKYSCLFSNDDIIAEDGTRIGVECGERVWHFPCGADFSDTLQSDVADFSQCTDSDYAEHIYAASLLSHFIEKDTYWMHIDLSSEYHEGGLGLIDTGVTGFGVRWGFKFIKDFIND